ncbi:hypothetical protein G6F43_004984 [Rhizopus delemar]|nr:hypothetical protein G6F43_004984 [Rhizopus delemar]
MKAKYLADTLKNVATYLHEYQEYMTSLKKNIFSVIGYVPKSKSREEKDTRKRLLDIMCSRLRSRSLVDRVFVAYCCNANDPLHTRDKKRQETVLEELKADGDTKDMLSHINTNNKVCLVALDHAGLSTNCEDLEEFIRNNLSLQKIIINPLPFNNKVIVYEREMLLNDSKLVKAFDCRSKPLQRSK